MTLRIPMKANNEILLVEFCQRTLLCSILLKALLYLRSEKSQHDHSNLSIPAAGKKNSHGNSRACLFTRADSKVKLLFITPKTLFPLLRK